MFSIQPTMIVAERELPDGQWLYRVRFVDKNGKEVEHTFTVGQADEGIEGLAWTHDFWEQTSTDPLVTKLTEAILCFHQARKI